MADQYSETRAARNRRDLDEMETLPADLQPLYQRLSDDGAAWQAASADKIAALAQSLVADIERMASDQADPALTEVEEAESGPLPLTPSPTERGGTTSHHRSRHMREWIAGTVAAVAVVALLALVLQGALVGRGINRPANKSTGQWQILDKLTLRRTSSGQTPPVIAPSNAQVVYEASNLESGFTESSKVVSYASLRRTVDGGSTWQTLPLPLPIANISTIEIRVSPFNAQTVFMSVSDRSSTACEPTNGVAGEGCQRGYVSYNGGDSWQKQTLPVRGILDLSQSFAVQFNRMYASNICNENSCIHLLVSADGGLTWQVVDSQITAHGQHVCSYAATPHSGEVYVSTTTNKVAPQPDCTESLSSRDLIIWRSDDGGGWANTADGSNHWTLLGTPPSKPQGSIEVQAGAGSWLSAPGGGLVYLHLLSLLPDSRPAFLYSEDYGVTWKSTPTVPDLIGSSAALSDGSLFGLTINPVGVRMAAYLWRPGERTWQALPQLPAEVAGPSGVLVTPGPSGHDTITLVLRANGDASNPIAYYVVRYQM